MKIAILIPVCSRNQEWTDLDQTYLMKASIPSLRATMSPNHEYTIYIGVDDDDEFFLSRKDQLPGKVVVLSNCRNAPAHAWNKLFETAVFDSHDYFFQMADDVILETPGWTERFIDVLAQNNNCGVVGPIHPENYYPRVADGGSPVIETAFVHSTHHLLFGYFFPWEIRNWYCDNWITEVYKNDLSLICTDIITRNLSITAPQQRYDIEYPDWQACIVRGQEQLKKGCFSFCLYGPECDKYYKGLLENVRIIQEHYPTWDIHVYASPEAEAFVQNIPGVVCFRTFKYGSVNMAYRFLSTCLPTYSVVCVRDTDSRIHARDRWCIQKFIESPYKAYTIRDHPWHRYRVMGGLWGVKRGAKSFSQYELNVYCGSARDEYGVDTNFLDTHVREPLLVFSYDPAGLFGNTNEKVMVIEEQGDFCGNVVLFDENGKEYNQF